MKTFLASIFASTPLAFQNKRSGKKTFQKSSAKILTPAVSTWLLTVSLACMNATAFAAKPVAKPDSASTKDNVSVTIPVLNNDRGLADKPISVRIVSKDSGLTASVNRKNKIRVRPSSGTRGKKTLVYRIKDRNGDQAYAAVTVNVTCTSCAQTADVTVRWKKGSSVVRGYNVYFGSSSKNATQQIADVTTNSATIDAVADLGLNKGDKACFRVKSYSNVAESDYSSAVCGTL